jgi:hypothetical protein
LLEEYAKNRIDAKKPRNEGRTYTIDKLEGLEKENLEVLAPFIDVVKIYGRRRSNSIIPSTLRFQVEAQFLSI